MAHLLGRSLCQLLWKPSPVLSNIRIDHAQNRPAQFFDGADVDDSVMKMVNEARHESEGHSSDHMSNTLANEHAIHVN